MKPAPVTYTVKITTTLPFGQLAAGLGALGDVDDLHRTGAAIPIQSALPFTNGAAGGPSKRKPRVISVEGRLAYRDAAQKKEKAQKERRVEALVEVLRTHAYAPMPDLVRAMNASGVHPNNNSAIPWSERSVRKYLDEALARLTAPGAPPIEAGAVVVAVESEKT
jgi:hypothetical protein